MKRIRQIGILSLTLVIMTIIAQSCCKESFKIIGKGDIGAYYGYYNTSNKTDTVDRETTIHWQLELRIASNINNFGLVQSCYATSCAETFENELIESTIEIFSDKDFNYNGNTIKANTNFADIDELEVFIVSTYGGVELTLTDDFLNKTEFEKNEYEFELRISTTDEKEFINNLTLFMKI